MKEPKYELVDAKSMPEVLAKAPYMTVAETMAQADRVKKNREIWAQQAREKKPGA